MNRTIRPRVLGATALLTALAGLTAVPAAQADPPTRPGTPLEPSCTAPDPTFSRTSKGVAVAPSGVAIGDFDKDGHPDVVSVGSSGFGDYLATVVHGNGSGGFGSSQDYFVNGGPQGITAADFDKSGYDDIAIAHLTIDGVPPLEVGINNTSGDFSLNAYAGGYSAQGITTADVDGDGDLDVVAATAGHASVWLGNGSGGFGAEQAYPAGTNPVGVTTGDFNDDGRLDLVTVNRSTDDVTILLQTASGFAAPVSTPVSNDPDSITSADFDGDGNLDVATSSGDSGKVDVLLGDGAGGFVPTPTLGPGNYPQAIATGDFNHDGIPDLAVATQDNNSVAVYVGRGNGDFRGAGFNAAASQPRSLAVADMNGDGLDDIVTGNYNAGSVSILTNTSRPGNTAPSVSPDSYTAPANGVLHVPAPGVLANDTDADCDPLTASRVNGPSHGVLDLKPNGSFTYTPTPGYVGSDSFLYRADDGVGGLQDTTVTLNVSTVDAIDDTATATESGAAVPIDVLDNDTDTDSGAGALTVTAVTQPAYGSVVITGGGTGVSYTPTDDFFGPDPFTYTASNALGRTDTATVTVTVAPKRGCATASFAAPQQAGALNSPLLVDSADFDGDGDRDLMSVNYEPDDTEIANNDGTGEFPQSGHYAPGTYLPDGQEIGDLNSDGRLDVSQTSFAYQYVGVQYGQAGGTLSGADNHFVDQFRAGLTGIGDIDNDGAVDVVGFGYGGGYIPLLGDGAGGLTPVQPAQSTPSGDSFRLADMNGDGNLDIVGAAWRNANDVWVMLGDGDGGFAPAAALVPTGTNPRTLVIADFDGDGNPDVATANAVTSDVSVLYGDGTGALSPAIELPRGAGAGASTAYLATGDMNADGRPDLVSINHTSGQVIVFLSRGLGGFAPPQTFDTGSSHANAVVVGDFNQDGSVDVVMAQDGQVLQRLDNQCTTYIRPTATHDTYVTAEDTERDVFAPGVLGNDTFGGTVTVSKANGPSHGTVDLDPDGSFTYTPDADYNGRDSFTYAVDDGHGGTDTGSVNLTVTPVADPPNAVDDNVTVAQDSGATVVDVLANDSDPDGDTLTVAGVTQGDHGSVSLTPEGVVSYTPASGYAGTDSFDYVINDGNGGTDTATVHVTVKAPNQAPVASDDMLTVLQDSGATTADVLSNDTDGDGDTLTITGVTQGSHGAVSITNNGDDLTYTPAAGYFGTDSFTYTVSDGNGGSDTATVDVGVTPISTLKVTSYDVGPSVDKPGHRWVQRRNAVADVIARSGASVVGLQEVRHKERMGGRTVHPIADLKTRMPQYSLVGNARKIKAPALVMYRTADFDAISTGTQRLAGTAKAARHCPTAAAASATFALLQDADTDQQYFVVSASLSNGVKCGAQRAAETKQLKTLISEANQGRGEVIVLGGLNADNTERAPRLLDRGLDPTVPRTTLSTTYNTKWDGKRGNDSHRLDYVFASSALTVTSTGVLRKMYRLAGVRTSPSSHYPVSATFRIP